MEMATQEALATVATNDRTSNQGISSCEQLERVLYSELLDDWQSFR
jgi:hypothetical protein